MYFKIDFIKQCHKKCLNYTRSYLSQKFNPLDLYWLLVYPYQWVGAILEWTNLVPQSFLLVRRFFLQIFLSHYFQVLQNRMTLCLVNSLVVISCNVLSLFKFVRHLLPFCWYFNFFQYGEGTNFFVTNISNSTKQYDFIFGQQLSSDELLFVCAFQICQTATYC